MELEAVIREIDESKDRHSRVRVSIILATLRAPRTTLRRSENLCHEKRMIQGPVGIFELPVKTMLGGGSLFSSSKGNSPKIFSSYGLGDEVRYWLWLPGATLLGHRRHRSYTIDRKGLR